MRIFSRTLFGFLASVLSASGFAGVCSKPLVVGWEAWEPYSKKNGEKVIGLDIEITEAIAADLGCKLTFKEMPWKVELAQLEEGRVDLAMGASKNSEREQKFLISKPYREEEVSLWMKAEDIEKYPLKQVEDLKDLNIKIGITNEYEYGERFSALLKNPEFQKKVQSINIDENNIKKLEFGSISAFLMDKYTGYDTIKKLTAKGELKIKIAKHPLQISASLIHFMFSKKTSNNEMVDAFNGTIDKLQKNGQLAAIAKKYQ